MCFSATASFAVAAGLAPAGICALAVAWRKDPSWLALAAYPSLFAIQQTVEGGLWLALASHDTEAIGYFARSFLFFSHFFWLAWVPFSVYLIEPRGWRKRTLLGLTITGMLFGLSIYLPALLVSDWLRVEIVHQSIHYETTLIYDGWLAKSFLRGIYVFIIVSSLLVQSNVSVRLFGLAIAASLILTFSLYAYAYISVWCFCAAILSLHLVFIVTMRRNGTACINLTDGK